MAAAAMAVLGCVTFAKLHDAGARLEREDRAVYEALMERLGEPGNITGVQIQVDSTMGDYERYGGFDKGMLGGMEFLHHEYLWGGNGELGEDMTITVTMYKKPMHPVVEWVTEWWDERFGTHYAKRTESMEMHRDGDVFRVRYGDASFTAACDAMTEWLDERADG